MRHVLCAALLVLLPFVTMAETSLTRGIVETHILPRFARLAKTSDRLSQVARADCAGGTLLQEAYSAAFDAWITASHLRFGPTERNDRGFALAFWPDTRGATPKTLRALIERQDPVANHLDDYAEVSIAARGFYALEFLLYDDVLRAFGDAGYRCRLTRTITADIASITAAISQDWDTDYAARLYAPTSNGTYRSDTEALQELFKAVSTGLQVTSETRLGRPLGTFERPRPVRAEAWRSGRTSRHVALSLASLRDMAIRLSGENAVLSTDLDVAFARAGDQLAQLNDPVLEGVSTPQTRFKIEVLQQSIETIRTLIRERLGPALGVASGFNALDGD